MIKRHSSRRAALAASVLQDRLDQAVAYDRIAGYFRSSLFEVAGEQLERVAGPIRILCNSEIDPADVKTAVAAQAAIRKNWCAGQPEKLPDAARPRIRRLYEFLTARLPNGDRKLEVKVLPNDVFGLIHGKAGLVHYADGRATTFLGSVNESLTAWRLNYELLWEDDSADAVKWVAEEFEALWHHPLAIDLSCCPFVEQDLGRLAERRVVGVAEWKETHDPAAVAVESPIYRKEQGLWPHQKFFARLALERHRLGSARLVLADQVGLGKTVQLGMATLLMALESDGPILVLAPKPLLKQWQGELRQLLHMPSARWTGDCWIDENEIEHPISGPDGLRACPRRIGLVSQGLITRGNPRVIDVLLAQKYACVVVDEAHRARRRELPKIDADDDQVDDVGEPNKLMAFLLKIGHQTRSMLLATATPVQLHPVEAWDLLRILSAGNPAVLGHPLQTSRWWRAHECLAVATGAMALPGEPHAAWEYVRDPLPSAAEDEVVARVRDRLKISDSVWTALPEAYDRLPAALRRTQMEPELFPRFGRTLNPMLRCIVRRTRQYLEEEINPTTREPWLTPVAVRLFGEHERDALALTPYLEEAYEESEKFTVALGKRMTGGAGFFRTLLLRRLGSSLEAGLRTIRGLLGESDGAADDDDTDEEFEDTAEESQLRNLTSPEIKSLTRCLRLLEQSKSQDPKLAAVLSYLLGSHSSAPSPWRERGCILFSQYFDTAHWMGEQLAKHTAFQSEDIGLYAGGMRSGVWTRGTFKRVDRDTIKERVAAGTLRLLVGTDAASEGLNLQRLGSLIHIDLPWNPTRLEQRKGRIQRIGQLHTEVWIANLRYRGSVEDRVHDLLSQRLEAIHDLFGQIPDTLQDVWVQVALGQREQARKLIDRSVALGSNPFDAKYSKVEDINWEGSSTVVDPVEVGQLLRRPWS